MAQRHSLPRTAAHTSEAAGALVEFHHLAGHPGTAELCQTCAAQVAAQRQASAAFRAHSRRTTRRIKRILGEASS